MLTDTFLTYGQPEPPIELIPLRAGPLAMLYDPTSGMVRRIKLGETEVLRGIYAAVRDRNWGTVPGAIRESVRKVETESFRIEFESDHHLGDIHFVWRGTFCGEEDGTVRYDFEGEAKTTFLRNRIGFCVLHPIHECAGACARQSRVDGTEVACRFPDLIEPQIFGRSSFQELRAIAHEVSPNLWAQVEFEGDTFEMEDQRNWTDASFKTYCTPLALPFPAEIERGTRVRQAVTMRLCSQQPRATTSGECPNNPPSYVGGDGAATNPVVTLMVPDAPSGRLPAIGLGVASHGEPLTETEMATLGQLRLSHLRVDVRLANPDFAVRFERAAREAVQLNAKLELALHLPREGEPDPGNLLRAVQQAGVTLDRILALREGEPATSLGTLAWAYRHFGTIGVPIGAGTDCNFCELNREHAQERLRISDSGFLFWPINPQVHAFDHHSIMETLEAQRATVASARAFAGGRPLVVSPVTLRQRFNPVATGKPLPIPPGDLPPQVDPRQLSHFAEAWTFGSIVALATAGVESVTYYETSGWRGVMERAAGSPLPEKFPSIPNVPFPVFYTLAQLSGFRQMSPVLPSSSHSLSALALFDGQRPSRVLVANLGETPQAVEVVWPACARTQLQLRPYEVVRADRRP